MSCKQINLDCGVDFSVDSGFYYAFTAELNYSVQNSQIFFDIQTPGENTLLLQLQIQTNEALSGIFIQDENKGFVDIVIIGADSANIKGNKSYQFYTIGSNGKRDIISEGTIQFCGGVINV